MNAITPNINYFAQYAEAASANQIEGKLLKFSKGDWTYGVDGLELPAGTRLVALMTTLTIGWQRWANGKPMDTRFGLVANGYQPPNRRELGDEDSAVWEPDANGDARDPWAFVNRFVLIRPDDNTVFTFSTSSRGGINAIGELCKTYSRAVPGKYPLVSLDVGSYSHSDPRVGRYSMWSSTWTPRLSMRRAANLRRPWGCPTSTKSGRRHRRRALREQSRARHRSNAMTTTRSTTIYPSDRVELTPSTSADGV
jgi:hypothetical protein